MQKAQYSNPLIYEAFDHLSNISADKKICMEAEIREKALRNKISELYAAREEGMDVGRKEGIEETAKKIISSGKLTCQDVMTVTGLSLEEINKIQSELKK